jgi:AcrR family transcriptional regulator
VLKVASAQYNAPRVGAITKDRRRDDILVAARDLLRQNGVEGFTMRALATRAGVSFVTVYNHFGAKRAIVQALATPPTLHFNDLLPGADGVIDDVFTALDNFVQYYLSDPELFRPVWLLLWEPAVDSAKSEVPLLASAFPPKLLSAAQELAVWRPEFEPARLLLLLDLIVRASMQAWASRQIAPSELSPSIGFAAALVLAGAASPAFVEPIQARAVRLRGESKSVLPKRD